MRRSVGLLVALLIMVVPGVAKAQPWGFVATITTSTTVGGGWNFGSGRATAGLWADISHSNDLTQSRPDFEVCSGLTVQLGQGWFVSPNVGAGATVTADTGNTDWSGRALVVFSRAMPVAFRLHWYSIIGVTTSSWLTKISLVQVFSSVTGCVSFPTWESPSIHLARDAIWGSTLFQALSCFSNSHLRNPVKVSVWRPSQLMGSASGGALTRTSDRPNPLLFSPRVKEE